MHHSEQCDPSHPGSIITLSNIPLSLSYHNDCQGIARLVFKSPLFYLIMASKYKNSDASNLEMPTKSHKVLSLSEKVKVRDLIRKEKKS